jgi:hypothetical protein
MSFEDFPPEIIEMMGSYMDPVTLACFSMANRRNREIFMSPVFTQRMIERWNGNTIVCPDGYQLKFEWDECWSCGNSVNVETETGTVCPFVVRWCVCDWYHMFAYPPVAKGAGVI